MRKVRFIPPWQLPTRIHTIDEVMVWHIRRVVLDSESMAEAAQRLGITRKTLWARMKKFGIAERPANVVPD